MLKQLTFRRDRQGKAVVVLLLVLVGLCLLTVLGSVLAAVSFTGQRNEAETTKDEALEAKRDALNRAEQAEAARDKAEEELKRAMDRERKATETANKQLEMATRLAGTLDLNKGLNLCDQGEAGQALLWMARGLKAAEGNPRFQDELRRRMAAWSRQAPTLRTILRHPAPVRAIAVSPDGKSIVTGCGDDQRGRVDLWSAAGGSPKNLSLPGQLRYIAAVAFSPDGKTIAAAGLEIDNDDVRRGSGQLWKNNKDLEDIGQPFVHDKPIEALAFSPDSKKLATGGQDGVVRFWDTTTGKQVGEPLKIEHPVWALAFDSTGKQLLVGSGDEKGDGEARLWEPAMAKPVGVPLPHQGLVYAVAFSPDGKTIATGSADRTARFWEAATGRPTGPPLLHPAPVRAIAFSPDGKVLLTGAGDNAARFWDTATGKQIGAALWHPGPVRAVAFSRDAKTIVTGSEGRPEPGRKTISGTARVWDAPVDSKPVLTVAHKEPISDLAVSPNGKLLATGGRDKIVQLWDAATGKSAGISPIQHEVDAWVYAVAFGPDDKWIATVCHDNLVYIWDVATGKAVVEPLKHPDAWKLNALAFRADGKVLVAGGADGENGVIQLWDLANGKPKALGKVLQQKTAPVLSVAISADGKSVLTGSSDFKARLWDLAAGSSKELLLPHNDRVTTVAFSPDGKKILTAGGKTAHILEGDKDTPLDHPDSLLSAVFSRDGRFIATAGKDRTVRLWDVGAGKLLGVPLLHPELVNAVAFAADGKALWTGCQDGIARKWTLSTLEGEADHILLWAQVCTGLELTPSGEARPLSSDEWQKRRSQLRSSAKGGTPLH
jgi:WD40 repeat protein